MTAASELPAPRGPAPAAPALPVQADATLRIVDGVARITLARPERGNALSGAMVETLLGAVAGACAAPSVHTLALTGAGRHFCTGLDLGGLEAASDGDLLLRLVRIEALLDAIWRAPVRTLAIARGRAWGAGADLFAACDLRLAAPDASFRFPGAAFGIVLGTRRLAERVGTDRARGWVAQGTTLDAAEAGAAGLASAVLAPPPDEGAGPDAWADWQRDAIGPAPTIDRETLAAIRAASRPAGGPGGDALADADLAALVRSASRPGLRGRIADYRARATAAARTDAPR
jgi:enoyl-CoA hydratase/carnithine racemase